MKYIRYSAFQFKGFYVFLVIFLLIIYGIIQYYDYTKHHTIAEKVLVRNNYTDIDFKFLKYKNCEDIYPYGAIFFAKNSDGEKVEGVVCSDRYTRQNTILLF